MSTPADQVQQAPSVARPKRFSLASQPGFRSTTLALSDPTVRSPVSDACLINAYAELDPEDKQYWVEKRPGTSTLTNTPGDVGGAGGVGVCFPPSGLPAASVPVAIYSNALYAYYNGVLNQIPPNVSSPALTPGRAANFIQIPQTDAPAGIGAVLWAANGGMWAAYIGPTVGRFAQSYESIQTLSRTFPTTTPLCDGVVYLDGTTYVMDQLGNIWGSSINDFTTWSGTTLIQAGGRYDQPVCLAQQLEYVIAFKSTSLRCFYDSGASAQTDGVGSNLAWVEGADANYGCANAGSLQLIDQTLLWVTNNDRGTPQVARMDGLQVQIVSTPAIERILQTLPMATFSAQPCLTTNVMYSAGIKRGGHRWYVITALVTSAVPFTLVYDLDQQMWSVWTSPNLPYWSVAGVSSASVPGTPGLVCQDISLGSLYVMDIDQVYPTDSGVPCQVDIYTPNFDGGTRRRKQLNALYWLNDQVSGSAMQVRKSDDDYRSWSPFRAVSLSEKLPRITRCGSFARRALNLRHQAATPFRIKAGEAQVDIGTL